MKINLLFPLASFACALTAGAANVGTAGYIYLNTDDPGGNYSFTANKGRWYENGAAIASGTAMAVGKPYLVQAASGYRVLRVGGNDTFPGASLTLDNGELRVSAGNPFTVNNLIVYNGRIQNAKSDAGQVKAAGAISIRPNGELHFNGAYRRLLECSATVTGDSTTKLIVDASENNGTSTGVALPFWATCLSGDNSAFMGSITVRCLSTGGAYPTALIARSGHSLGASSPITFDSRAALLGDGFVLDDARTMTVGAKFTLGSYTANGLRLDGGATIKGSGASVVYVTNCVASAVTTLGDVALSGIEKIVVQNGTVKFASGYDNRAVAIEVAPGAKISAEDGAVLGSVASSESNGFVSVAFPTVDRAALNRSNEGFSYPLLSAASIDLDDYDLYGGVTRESFVVRENASGVPTLYWERAASDYTVYYMAKSDDQSGYAVDASWSNHGEANSSPSSLGDYIVESGKIVRQRSTSKTAFPGHVLNILEGGDLSVYDTIANTADLNLYETAIAQVRGTSSGTIAGTATIRTSADGQVKFSPQNGTLTLSAALAGYGNASYCADGTSSSGSINVTGENTAFVGKVAIPSSKISVRFKYESALGGNPRKFAADGLSVGDGVTLWCTATYPLSVTQPNRGVTVKGAAKVDVESGLTCRMTTPITGAGSLVKKSAGTLELSGANDFTGGVTLEDGVLKLTSETALGTGALTYAAGSIDHVATGAVVVKGETPIVTAKPVPVRVAALDDDPYAWAPVFCFPDVASMTKDQAAALFAVTNVNPAALDLDVTADAEGVLVSARKKTGLVIILK